MNENYKFVSAEVLLCSSCNQRHSRKISPELKGEVKKDLPLKEKHNPDQSELISKRLKNYYEMFNNAFNERHSFELVEQIFERYSLSALYDLDIDIPSYHWFNAALENRHDDYELKLRYMRFVTRELFGSIGKNTQRVDRFIEKNTKRFNVSLDGMDDYLVILEQFESARLKKREVELAKAQKCKEHSLKEYDSMSIFLYNLRSDPRSLPLIDEEFVWHMQQAQEKSQLGEDSSMHIEALCLPHLGYVIHLAKTFLSISCSGKDTFDTYFMDLVQEGFLSMRRSFAHSYDWHFEGSQITPIHKSLYTDIKRAFVSQVYSGSLSVNIRSYQKLQRYMKSWEITAQSLKREPDLRELKDSLIRIYGLSEKQANSYLKIVALYDQRPRYFSEQLSQHDDDNFWGDSIPDTYPDPLELELLLDDIESFLGDDVDSYDTDTTMIALKLGILTGREHSLQEIGNMYGLTRERIRQRISSKLDGLREHLKDYRRVA